MPAQPWPWLCHVPRLCLCFHHQLDVSHRNRRIVATLTLPPPTNSRDRTRGSPLIKSSNQSSRRIVESSPRGRGRFLAHLCKSLQISANPAASSFTSISPAAAPLFFPHDSLGLRRSPPGPSRYARCIYFCRRFLSSFHVGVPFFLLLSGVAPGLPSMMWKGVRASARPQPEKTPRRSAPSLRMLCPGVINTDWRAGGRTRLCLCLAGFASFCRVQMQWLSRRLPKRATQAKTHGLAPASKLPRFDAWKPPRFHCAFCGSRRLNQPVVSPAACDVLVGWIWTRPTRGLGRPRRTDAFAPHLKLLYSNSALYPNLVTCSFSSAA